MVLEIQNNKKLAKHESFHDDKGPLASARTFLSSHTFHYFIVGLVILDVLIVMTDLGIFLAHAEFHASHSVEHALHALRWISLVILCIFEVEFIFCILCFGLKWLCQVGHFIDVLVVTFSLSFDIIEHNEEHFEIAEVVALMIIVRLWRIARIGHAFAETALFEMELIQEQREDENLTKEAELKAKEKEIEDLKKLLKKHQIGYEESSSQVV